MNVPAPSTVVIVNEHAGGGRMADVFRRVEHRLDGVLDEWEIRFTDGPNHATELTRDALRGGADTILVAGGDGTVNETVNGFFEPLDGDSDEPPVAINPQARMGLLAGGTGGDFRKTLRIPDMDSAIAALARGETRTIDLGLLTYTESSSARRYRRLFQNITSVGLGGLVDRYVKDLPRLPGKLAYAAASLRALLVFKNPMLSISIDGGFEAELPAAIVAVGNGRFFGGGMMACPDAKLDDGLFDVTIMGDLTKWELATLSRTIYDGGHIYDAKVITRQGRVVSVDALSTADVLLDVDGEPLGRLPATFQLVPGALKIIAPQ